MLQYFNPQPCLQFIMKLINNFFTSKIQNHEFPSFVKGLKEISPP